MKNEIKKLKEEYNIYKLDAIQNDWVVISFYEWVEINLHLQNDTYKAQIKDYIKRT